MLVLDALFDHFHQISSNVEIIGRLVQCSPISAVDVGIGRQSGCGVSWGRLPIGSSGPADVWHPIWICWRTWVTQGSPRWWPIDPVMLVCSTRHNSAPSLLSAREKCAVVTA